MNASEFNHKATFHRDKKSRAGAKTDSMVQTKNRLKATRKDSNNTQEHHSTSKSHSELPSRRPSNKWTGW